MKLISTAEDDRILDQIVTEMEPVIEEGFSEFAPFLGAEVLERVQQEARVRVRNAARLRLAFTALKDWFVSTGRCTEAFPPEIWEDAERESLHCGLSDALHWGELSDLISSRLELTPEEDARRKHLSEELMHERLEAESSLEKSNDAYAIRMTQEGLEYRDDVFHDRLCSFEEWTMKRVDELVTGGLIA